jgi:hypothetical protein
MVRVVVPAAIVISDLGPGLVGLEIPANLLVEDPPPTA